MLHTKKTLGDIIFDIVNVVLLLLLMAICLYPMLYVISASLSIPSELSRSGGFLILPKGFQLQAYKLVFENPDITSGYLNTIFYVVVGTLINLFLTILGAYVLSRKGLKFKKILTFYILLTMFVNGGLVPSYLLVKSLGILNTRLALLLPSAIGTYNLIMTRTYFNTIPVSLEESARIDGASHWTILSKIILPLSAPIIAVISLYYAVGHWNSWFSAMIYLKERSQFPLQLILREILILNQTGDMMQGNNAIDKLPMSDNIKYATIVAATLPVLFVYPMLQKYFVKGVMIGAVKE